MAFKTLNPLKLSIYAAFTLISSTLLAQAIVQSANNTSHENQSNNVLQNGIFSEQTLAKLDISIGLGLSVEGIRDNETAITDAETYSLARLQKVDLGFQSKLGRTSQVRSSYSFDQRLYSENTRYDLQTHYAFLDLRRELPTFDAGVIADGTYARVGNNLLLNKQGIGLYFSARPIVDTYSRIELRIEQLDYNTDVTRSSFYSRLDATGYYFLAGADQYVLAGYRHQRRYTQSYVLNYTANQFSLGYVQRVPALFTRTLKLRLDWRHEHRQYETFDAIIDENRTNIRSRWRVRADAPINQLMNLQFAYEYRRYFSDRTSADITDNRFQTLIELTLL